MALRFQFERKAVLDYLPEKHQAPFHPADSQPSPIHLVASLIYEQL